MAADMQNTYNRNRGYSIVMQRAMGEDGRFVSARGKIVPDCKPPLENPSSPQQQLPADSWDCHCHVFGPSDIFPYAEGRSYTPPDAPVERVHALHRHLGIARAVVVQAACHGLDHSALFDAIAKSNGRYLGVGLLSPEATEADVRVLHDAGVRGVRFNFVAHLGKPPTPAVFDRLTKLVAPFGWHVSLHVDGAALKTLAPVLRHLPLPFVVDHMARIRAVNGLAADDFQLLLDLEGVPNAWVKVSGIDRIGNGVRPFAEGIPFIHALVKAMPERTLWGTDWPHPNVAGDMPDEGELVDSFFAACPDADLRRLVLVENPKALYERKQA
jgi:2-pyrone-4,6-dicarboxylate lactonase